MATRQVLTELAEAYESAAGVHLALESVGGVDAAKRVQAGEVFDIVFLASDAIEKLLAAGHLAAGSRVDLVHSGVAVAVKEGAAAPDISSEAAVRAAVLSAPTLSYSTGPSGVALAKLFERWGIADEIQSRIVQAPPGVPVGTLVARGEVALGFQQLSELMHLDGISVVGVLPEALAITTIFSAATCAVSSQPLELARFYAFMSSREVASVKQQLGMQAISI
jgi:molybdate transport system substrate-binding protein